MGLRRSPFLIMTSEQFSEAVLFSSGKRLGTDYGFIFGRYFPFSDGLKGYMSVINDAGYIFWEKFADKSFIEFKIAPKTNGTALEDILTYLITSKLKLTDEIGFTNGYLPTQKQNPEGLHQRYRINKIRADGTTKPVDKDADYFVLRLDEKCKDKKHIKACRQALLVYAIMIEEHLPQLSKEILQKYGY